MITKRSYNYIVSHEYPNGKVFKTKLGSRKYLCYQTISNFRKMQKKFSFLFGEKKQNFIKIHDVRRTPTRWTRSPTKTIGGKAYLRRFHSLTKTAILKLQKSLYSGNQIATQNPSPVVHFPNRHFLPFCSNQIDQHKPKIA